MLTKEEIKILDKRLASFKKNPKNLITWDEIKRRVRES